MNADFVQYPERSALEAQLTPIKKKLRRAEVVTRFYALPSLLFMLAFSLPIVGNIIAVTVGGWLGCSFGEHEARNCPVFGNDLAEIFYEYGISMLMAGIFNPFLFFRGISIIMTPVIAIGWIASVVWLYALRYRFRRKLWLTRLNFERMHP